MNAEKIVLVIPVTTEKQQYCYEVKTSSDDKEVALEILLGASGTTYLDNIYMYEANKTMNGNFTNEVTGYEFYIDDAANATYAVDELTEGGALGFTINNIADSDDSIQLVQKNLRLEKGKTYTIQFDGKTDLNRDVKIEVKKDGEDISYSGEAIHGLSKGYRTYSHTFTMEEETDNNAVVVIYLGKINDNTTKKTHVVYLDNINLLEE